MDQGENKNKKLGSLYKNVGEKPNHRNRYIRGGKMNNLADQDIPWDDYLKRDPDLANVKPAMAFYQDTEDYFHSDKLNAGVTLPWSKTHADIQLRPGEVSVWAGINGHGKSLLLNQVMLNIIKQEQSVVLISLEMKPVSNMARMCRQASGFNLPEKSFIKAFHHWANDKLWFYDQQGTIQSSRVMAVMNYCYSALLVEGVFQADIKHIVIDSLMKCGIGGDDYNKQKFFVNELCAYARDTGIHVHLVAHSRKRDSERHVMDKFDIAGSGDITNQVDNVFTLWRNKDKEAESTKPNPDPKKMDKPDALLMCDKQRHGEWEGKVALWFHKPSLQYTVRANSFIPYFNQDELENRLERVNERRSITSAM